MTREEAKSCIGTIELLQRLAYNIHGVMDVIDANNCKKIIKALEQEPRKDEVILTREEYGELVSNEFDNGYAKGYREALEEQEPTTKNDLAVDAISRQAVLDLVADYDLSMGQVVRGIHALPSVTPQNQVYPLCEDCHTKMDEVRRAYDNAMKQEPILDKIRAEIEQIKEAEYQIYGKGSWRFVDKCLDIIDKYKTEIEPQESEDV